MSLTFSERSALALSPARVALAPVALGALAGLGTWFVLASIAEVLDEVVLELMLAVGLLGMLLGALACGWVASRTSRTGPERNRVSTRPLALAAGLVLATALTILAAFSFEADGAITWFDALVGVCGIYLASLSGALLGDRAARQDEHHANHSGLSARQREPYPASVSSRRPSLR